MTAFRTQRAALPRIVDALVIAGLVVVAGLALGPAYGGSHYLAVVGAGAAIGLLAALLPALADWPAWTTIPAVVVGYLSLSGVAVPAQSAHGFPTLETMRIAVAGVITSWKQMLTVAVPIGSSGALLIPAYVAATVTSTVGVLLAVRGPAAPLAMVGPAAMAMSAAALGTASAWLPALVGSVLGVVGLVWAAWRRRRFGLPGLEVRRPLGIAVVLLAAVGVGVFVGPSVLAGADRQVLRTSVTPPFDPQAYPSPLAGFRKYVKAERTTPLFTVAGLPSGARIRLAALDSYDGILLGTSAGTGTFVRVGDRVSGVAAGAQANLLFQITGYSDVWLPTAGYLAAIHFTGSRATELTDDFRYDRGTGTGVVTSGLIAGDGYQAVVSLPADPSAGSMAGARVSDVNQPLPQGVPDVVKTKAQQYAQGASDPYQVATALATGLRNAGYFSHGDDGTLPSPAGHGADRMIKLLSSPTMVGDQEQYAVAMMLMARSLGLPARVVMGFDPWQQAGGSAGSGSSSGLTGPVTITGADVTAWVEIPFDGVGWVAFDPTPDQQKVPQQQSPDQQQNAHQQDVQPPPPPEPPERAETTQIKDKGNPDTNKPNDQQQTHSQSLVSGIPVGAVLGVGIPVVVLALPVLIVLTVKSRRARRRRTSGAPAARVAGGWSEVVDRATDLGVRPAPGATRTETAAQFDSEFGGSTAVLARTADTSVFSPDPVEPEEAEAYWGQVRTALDEMDRSASPWRRWRARVALASLRRRGP
jgi:transglutaminase-like putative cysteine protease